LEERVKGFIEVLKPFGWVGKLCEDYGWANALHGLKSSNCLSVLGKEQFERAWEEVNK